MSTDAALVTRLALRPREEKERHAVSILSGLDRVIVALSGGVDSAVLLGLALEALGPARVRAALASGPSLPARDREDAARVAEHFGVPLLVVETGEFEDERYLRNAADRCYWCRSALVEALAPCAATDGATLVYGPVADDLEEERPGMEAAARGGFRAPLLEAGLTKDDVRALARARNLPVWDKPASACLASRVPTGTRIDPARLTRVDRAESAVRDLGFRVVRVRDEGDVARVELGADEIARIADPDLRAALAAALKACGFRRAAVDLEGYRPVGLRVLPRL